MLGRELALAKREGEVAAREEEADLRAADLEVFRAMLVNQESTVKDLTSEAKEYCKTLAESAHSTGTVELASVVLAHSLRGCLLHCSACMFEFSNAESQIRFYILASAWNN